jgi:hypothetical protein
MQVQSFQVKYMYSSNVLIKGGGGANVTSNLTRKRGYFFFYLPNPVRALTSGLETFGCVLWCVVDEAMLPCMDAIEGGRNEDGD